jgi:predicted transposase YdaD
MGKADVSSKRAITMYAQAWLEWALQEQGVRVMGEVSGEFQFVERRSDSLLQARGPSGPFLALTEFQLRYDPEIPQRLAAYAALARQKYKQDVFVTVVYLLPPPANVTPARVLHRELMGQTTHQDFQVIALWELEAGQMLTLDNPALLPFVPLMQGGATQETVVACAERLRREPDGLELETILSVFASYVLDAAFIKQLLRWNMTIITESPLIQELLKENLRKGKQKWLKQGLLQGRQEGEQEGRQQGERNATLKNLRQILTIRFDAPPPDFEQRLQPLDLPALGRLITASLTLSSLAEFEQCVANELEERAATFSH